jgi:GAF domain-containing protein
MTELEEMSDGPTHDDVTDEVAGLLAERSDAVSGALAELGSLLLENETLETTLDRVSQLAARTVPGCDGAGVTVVDALGHAATVAATGELVLRVDRRQYEAGQGPCLDALRTRTVVSVDVEEAAERYPDFAGEARALGVRSFLAAPLVAGDAALGSLNLYSRATAGFDALDEALVALFVGQASVAVANARLYDSTRRLTDQMSEAMTSRSVIEQAKGVLMGRHGVDAQQAFDLLRERSQRANVKLHLIAEAVVREASTAQGSGTPDV